MQLLVTQLLSSNKICKLYFGLCYYYIKNIVYNKRTITFLSGIYLNRILQNLSQTKSALVIKFLAIAFEYKILIIKNS